MELDKEKFLALVQLVTDRIDKAIDESDNGPATILALSAHLHRIMVDAVRDNQAQLVENVIEEWEQFFKTLRVLLELKKAQAPS